MNQPKVDNKAVLEFGGIVISPDQRLALSLSLSLYLECLQVVFSLGIFDVDDLMLNTSGGVFGYGAIKLYNKVYSKFIVNT